LWSSQRDADNPSGGRRRGASIEVVWAIEIADCLWSMTSSPTTMPALAGIFVYVAAVKRGYAAEMPERQFSVDFGNVGAQGDLVLGSKNQRKSALIAKSVIAARQGSHILDLEQIAEPFAALPRPLRLGSIAANLFARATAIAEAEHVLKSGERPVFLETAFDRLAKTLDQFENEASRWVLPFLRNYTQGHK
jgi:hypothetical protein